jgi:hypothetical protein
MRREGLGKLRELIHLIVFELATFPPCSIVPQPLLYRVPSLSENAGMVPHNGHSCSLPLSCTQHSQTALLLVGDANSVVKQIVNNHFGTVP